jgi:hypothetical protein
MNKALALFAVCMLALATSVASQGQFLPPDGLVGHWDDLNQRILYHRVALKPSSIAVYAADVQGGKTLAIDVLKDFPGALQGWVEFENIAGGPDGSVVLFCLLDYGVRPLKELILTYSSAGALKSTIDAAGYEASALTVDDQGNIYIFGSNYLYDLDDPHAVYPTVVEYDPAGHIVKKMLPSSNFPAGDDPTDLSDENGSPLLRVTSKGIALFGALSGRWFLLSQRGDIIAQHDLSGTTRKIAAQYKFRRESVSRSFLDQNGWPVFHLRLDDGPFDQSNVPPPDQMRFQEPLVKVDPSTAALVEIEKEVQFSEKQIIGIDKDGTPVYVHGGVRVSVPAGILRSSKPE